jgi:hypothetical protein
MSFEVSQNPVRSRVQDTGVSAIAIGLAVGHDLTSGVAAVGMGVSALLELPDAAGNRTVAGKVQSVWLDATNGSEDARTSVWSVTAGTVQEYVRLGNNEIRLYGAALHWGVGDADAIFWDAQFQKNAPADEFTLAVYNTSTTGWGAVSTSGDTAFATLRTGGSAVPDNFFAAHAPEANLTALVAVDGELVISTGTAAKGIYFGYGAQQLGLRIDGVGNIVPKTAALAVGATDGFFYLLGFENTPTGVPASTYAGRVPFGYDLTNNRLYARNGGVWVNLTSAGVTDHGALTGLLDDDHTQYHTDARGDIRYYTKAEHISTSAGAGDAGKPIVLDAGGQIDATMLNDADVDHGSIGGLIDDDHTQYALLAGRAGGQTQIGGTAASENYTLQSTSNVTRGYVIAADRMSVPVGTALLPSIAFTGDLNTGIWSISADNISFSTGGGERLRLASTQFYSIVPVRTDAGAAGSPSYSANSDTNTGTFFPGADRWAVSTGGTQRFEVSTTAIISTLQFQGPVGSNAAPTYSFTGDANSGVYSNGADQVSVAAGGVEQMRVTATQVLVVDGSATAPAIAFISDVDGGMYRPAANEVALAVEGVQRLTIFGPSSLQLLTVKNGANTPFQIDEVGTTSITQRSLSVAETGKVLVVTGGAHLDLGGGGERNDVDFVLGRTINFADGTAISTQRSFKIDAPTFTADVAKTITDAATVYISGAPIDGDANITITRAYALWIDSGFLRYDETEATGADVLTLTNGPTATTSANPNGYIKYHVGTQAVVTPYWHV